MYEHDIERSPSEEDQPRKDVGSSIPVEILTMEDSRVEDRSPREGSNGATTEEATSEEFRERWLRAAAELENIQKRTARKIELARQRERTDILAAMLEVADSIERALSSDNNESSSWEEGMRAIQQQMLSVLKRFGAEPIRALGERFDPNMHEAVAVTEDTDHPDGSISMVLQAGYAMTDGTLLRPARVVVAKRSA